VRQGHIGVALFMAKRTGVARIEKPPYQSVHSGNFASQGFSLPAPRPTVSLVRYTAHLQRKNNADVKGMC
jgi:hypothetical protein